MLTISTRRLPSSFESANRQGFDRWPPLATDISPHGQTRSNACGIGCLPQIPNSTEPMFGTLAERGDERIGVHDTGLLQTLRHPTVIP